MEVVNPTETALSDAHLFLEFVNITGTVVSEVSSRHAVTLPPGPTTSPVAWDTADFDPAYSADEDYIVMAFWTDYQGNILDTAGRPLSSFQEDPAPAFAMATADEIWDFGTAQQGTLLKRQFALASVGYGPADPIRPRRPTSAGWPDRPAVHQSSRRAMTWRLYTVLNSTPTACPWVAFEETIPVRTSDPAASRVNLTIQGTITAMPADSAGGAVQRPLDWTATIRWRDTARASGWSSRTRWGLSRRVCTR